MAKIVSHLAKNVVSSGRVLQFQFQFQFQFNSNSNSISTPTPTNLIYLNSQDRYPYISKVSKIRYPMMTNDHDHDHDDDDSVLFNYLGHLKICSHSHGIVCFSDCQDDIFLFNPFTRLFLPLHPPPILPSHIFRDLPRSCPVEEGEFDTGDWDLFHENGVRFCYYPDSNHFKVVRFVSYQWEGGLHNTLAHVYNSNTGHWRQIFNTPVQGPFPFWPGPNVFHDGVHSSITYTHDREFIQSFDMNREVFNPLIPLSNVTYLSQTRQLHIWNGSLVLLSYENKDTDREIFHIWCVDKDDESGAVSLSELCTFRSHRYPLLFANSDELLMIDSDEKVVSQNLKTQEIKYLPVKANHVSFFENSLVSFQGETCTHEGVIP